MIERSLLFIACLLTINHSSLSQVDDTTFQKIEEVIVTSEKEKKIVFGDPKYYIVDFAISDSNAILLMKNLRTYYVYELDEFMNFRHKLKLDFDADFLFDDCFGNTHIVSRDSVYHIFDDEYGLFLTETHPRRGFMRAMKKCVGSTSEKIIFEKKANYNQDQTFYTVDLDSGDRKVIYEVKDTEISRSMREAAAKLYLLEYLENDRVAGKSSERYEDDILNTEASMKAEIDAHRIKNGMYDRATFVASHVLRSKYNPLFTLDDTIYVFNHFMGKIDVLSQAGGIIRSIPISHHLSKDWDETIHLDNVRKQFYAVHMRKGVQHLIRLGLAEDDQNSSSKITKHAYPKKVVVRNGIAYYTYKPYFDANLNKLYMQRL
ncbi:MAG: hypothetical protein AB8B56_03185 [Crocinitomicaceae bacterium]